MSITMTTLFKKGWLWATLTEFRLIRSIFGLNLLQIWTPAGTSVTNNKHELISN